MSKKKLDHLGVSAFCESMAMMVHSGIQTDEAIALLQTEKHGTGGILEQGLAIAKEKVDEGATLYDALNASGIFPEYALDMINVGESSGHLENILFRLSKYYAEQKTISEKLRNAVIYPAVMLVLVIAVLTVLLTLVLPAFTDVYNTLTGSLAASNYRYVYLAYVFCWIALIAMIILAVLLICGLIMWKTGHRETVEKLISKNRLCASILESMAMFRFTSALATFLASGELQDDAVKKSIPMTGYAPLEAKLERCLSRMSEGHSFAQAAYDEELFEPVYGRMLLAGERSGNIESVLERLAGLLEERAVHQVDRLVGIVDPLLSGILMVSVGLSLLSVMLPLIGIMNSVG